jgi:hypothetical protein
MIKYILLFLFTINIFASEKLSILVPLYSHPSKWIEFEEQFKIIKNKQIPTYAIINPHNGPGEKADKSYINGIKYLKKFNINIIGYVHTEYSKRNIHLIKEDIYKWSDFYFDYGMDGIFFDETDTNENSFSFYDDLLKYTRNLDFKFNILNAGYTTSNKYIDSKIANVVITYEQAYINWINKFPSITNTSNDFTKLSLLVHTMKKNDFQNTINLAKKRGFEYIYLTQDTLPNPWDDFELELLKNF